MLYDLGSHLIDQALTLFGQPQWIWADMINQRPTAQIDDYFHIVMGYDEKRVVLHASSMARSCQPRFILHGSKGSFIKYGIDPQEQSLREGKRLKTRNWGKEKKATFGTLITTEGKHRVPSVAGNYAQFYQSVLNAILNHEPPPITCKEALLTIYTIELAKKSASNRQVLPFGSFQY